VNIAFVLIELIVLGCRRPGGSVSYLWGMILEIIIISFWINPLIGMTKAISSGLIQPSIDIVGFVFLASIIM
jgi:hypothetical protein